MSKRLILLSKHFMEPAQEVLREFTGKPNNGIRLAFCANAGNRYENDRKEYIEIARQELINSNYQLVELDLNSDIKEILEILSKVDATFFTGGSFYYLMGLFNKSGLTEHYEGLLDKGLIHIGFSAGSMICSNDFKGYDSFAEYKDESISKALGLFPYYLVPHYSDKPKYNKAFEDIIKAGYQNVIPLTNNQAIIVDGDEWKIV